MICCRCLSNNRSTPIACLAIFIAILVYNVIGGFIFLFIEFEKPPSILHGNKNLSEVMCLKAIERLWEINESKLNKENWTKLANQELLNFIHKAGKSEIKEPDKQNQHWTFISSFLYALTVITTIGNESMIPRTLLGKAVAIIYCFGGIPLVMWYLSSVAKVIATKYRRLYSKYCPISFKIKNFHSKKECPNHRYCNTSISNMEFIKIEKILQNKDQNQYESALDCLRSSDEFHWMCPDHTNIPITGSVLLIGIYIIIGAFIFRETEGIKFTDAYYFTFSVMAAIGLGSIKPGLDTTHSTHTADSTFGICCLYILFGIVVVSICYNLIADDFQPILDKFNLIFMGPPKPSIFYTITASKENKPTKSSEVDRGSQLSSKLGDSNYVRSYSVPEIRIGCSNSIEYFIPRSLSEFNLGNNLARDLETIDIDNDESHRVKMFTFEEDPVRRQKETNELSQITVM